MIDAAVHGQVFIRVAVQAVGRVGTQGDGVNHRLPRAVMTGGAGTDAVGVDIVLGTFDLGPVRHHVTVAAGLTRRVIGEVVGTD